MILGIKLKNIFSINKLLYNIRAILQITGSKGLIYDKAGGTLVDSRTSTATFTDFEGIVKTAGVGEIRFNRGRRVENLIDQSSNLLGGVWTSNNATIDTNEKLSFISPIATVINNMNVGLLLGRTFTLRAELKGDILGTVNVRLSTGNGTFETSNRTVNITNNYKKYNFSKTFTYTTSTVLQLQLRYEGTGLKTVYIKNVSVEEVTNQFNKVASEYIPTGTSVIQNSGVEGVAYFTYLNGSTVDADNNLTESKGIAFATKPEMLSEGLSTNILPYSEDFNNNIWTKTHSTVGTSSNRNGITTQQLVDTTANNHHRFSRALPVTAGVDYTLSVYLKKINRYALLWLYGVTTGTNIARCYFDLQAGIIANLQIGTASIEDMGNGLFRCSITTNSGANTQILSILQSTQNSTSLIYTGTGVPVLEVGGVQLEQSSDLTSYIPTTTAAVSRSADNINLPLVSGVNFNPNEGVLLFKFKPDYNLSTVSGHLFEVSTNFGTLLYDHPVAGLLATYNGIATNSISIGTINKNNTYLVAVIWSQTLNSLKLTVSTDNGTTWMLWGATTMTVPFVEGSVIGLFTNLKRTAFLDSAVLYDKLPKPTMIETQTWVEDYAGDITS